MKFTDRYKNYAGESAQAQLDFLDSIDFTPYLVFEGMSLTDIMDTIEFDYGSSDFVEMPEELEGNVFNNMDETEFAEYLEERYPGLLIREVVEIHHEIYRRPVWS